MKYTAVVNHSYRTLAFITDHVVYGILVCLILNKQEAHAIGQSEIMAVIDQYKYSSTCIHVY